MKKKFFVIVENVNPESHHSIVLMNEYCPSSLLLLVDNKESERGVKKREGELEEIRTKISHPKVSCNTYNDIRKRFDFRASGYNV